MNQNRREVRVPQSIIERGMRFGFDIVEFYAKNPNSMSAAVSGEWGAEKDPIRQAQGKIGEAAAAIFFGLDPEEVNWSPTLGGDGGVDLVLPWRGCRIDVKTTLPPFKLIWSRSVNHLFWKKPFDLLCSVSIDGGDLSRCWVEGWISKGEFFRKKTVATFANSNLSEGTWFISKASLLDASELLQSSCRPMEYFCEVCGREASFGTGASPLRGVIGRWRCMEHR